MTSRSSQPKNFLYLAYRYLFTKHHDATIKLMMKICFIGVLIATCSLALVISIMNGFEQATYEKMQSIYPDVIIETNDAAFDMARLTTILADPRFGVLHAAPQKYAQALLCNPESADTPNMLVIRGIIPEQEMLVSNIASKIIDPLSKTVLDLVHDHHIIIGSALAKQLNLQVGDHAYILCCQEQSLNLCMQFEQTQVIIAGIFKTGIDELDTNMTICHQSFFDSLFQDHPINQMHLKINNLKYEKKYIKALQETLHADIYSWKDLYPTLLAALKLEKWAMVFILILIIFVASMNIMSLISMYITQKKRDIAILLCFGMKQNDIKKIFVCMSLMISAIASLIGLILACSIGLLLQNYAVIKLPDNVYDTDYLPVKLELLVFCAIFIKTILISVMASLLATRNVQRIKIIDTLKTP